MATNFPDPSQSPWTNPDNGITYEYDNGVWVPQSSGGGGSGGGGSLPDYDPINPEGLSAEFIECIDRHYIKTTGNSYPVYSPYLKGLPNGTVFSIPGSEEDGVQAAATSDSRLELLFAFDNITGWINNHSSNGFFALSRDNGNTWSTIGGDIGQTGTVAYTGGQRCAVRKNGHIVYFGVAYTDNLIFTSVNDGATFERHTLANTSNYGACRALVALDSNEYVAIDRLGLLTLFEFDGSNITITKTASASDWGNFVPTNEEVVHRSLFWHNDKLITNADRAGSNFVYSTDKGDTFAPMTVPANTELFSGHKSFDGSKIIFVGALDGASYVFETTDGINVTPVSAIPFLGGLNDDRKANMITIDAENEEYYFCMGSRSGHKGADAGSGCVEYGVAITKDFTEWVNVPEYTAMGLKGTFSGEMPISISNNKLWVGEWNGASASSDGNRALSYSVGPKWDVHYNGMKILDEHDAQYKTSINE